MMGGECPVCDGLEESVLGSTLGVGTNDDTRAVLQLKSDGEEARLFATAMNHARETVSIAAAPARFCPNCGRRLGVVDEEPPRVETAKRCPFTQSGTKASFYGLVDEDRCKVSMPDCSSDCALRINGKCAFRVMAEGMR